MTEKYMTARELSQVTGISDEFIRSAMRRSSEFHPLPHIKCGYTRPVRKASMSTFQQWLREEEQLTAEGKF